MLVPPLGHWRERFWIYISAKAHMHPSLRLSNFCNPFESVRLGAVNIGGCSCHSEQRQGLEESRSYFTLVLAIETT
jgi:hypothetical protein